ncbi:MAG TPA: bifunctional transaldolase/phosoglucose isomerase [Nitrococcus sp.]|nr:bifunctional transaldolase/phosoglucose isomerase [Nitrococcus sp.]
MNPLKALNDYGQVAWLDFLARRFIADGDLKRLVVEDGLTGITSNPSIFEKAILGNDDYDGPLKKAEEQGDLDVGSLFERLAVEDIQHAADVLRPVYEATQRRDGYVSIEVSPYLAMDTEGTVAEARRLWQAVGRENLMVKVPATAPGLPAIRQLIGAGINVNITLLFSQEVYEQVVTAYLGGLEDLIARDGDPSRIASVASFFVSRIDTAVDQRIEGRLRQTDDAAERDTLTGILGKVAIANAKLAYQRYRRRFAGPLWENLQARGAHTQRLLWASTGTKNPEYSDVRYVEGLIGPDTVNTMPPKTMDAFRDHGKLRASLEEDLDGARHVMVTLDRLGISIDEVTAELVEQGVRLFADAADKLLGAVARKRAAVLGPRLNRQSHEVDAALAAAITPALETWRIKGNIRRLWQRDVSLWTGGDEAHWLGWLDVVDEQRASLNHLTTLAAEIRQGGFSDVLLLGMGGSSLGPEVLGTSLGAQSGFPTPHVLDSTDPAQIRNFEKKINLAKTLFIVSSKSGTTLEPNVFKQYFFERAAQRLGREEAGQHFIAITDPGSQLQQIAERDRFRRIYFGVPSIGGRYSVLSNFGMVPAAVSGIDIQRLLASACKMVRACAASAPPADNPGVLLGGIMGVLAQQGRDKLTIIASPGISGFGAWAEQLIAESTGKHGKGLIPVDAEPLGSPEVYGNDRLFVYLRLDAAADPAQDAAIEALARAGQPVVRIALAERYQLGQEFFRWELAVAVAGAIIGINPFDQPDVEASKIKTRELTAAYEKTGMLPEETPIFEANGLKLFADERNAQALRQRGAGASLESYLKAHLERLGDGDYFAVLAYIERNAAHMGALQPLRAAIRDRWHVATCLGFGPRFLHSTGQAYKGGPNSGVFLQVTCDDAVDLDIPGQAYSFGVIKTAQARGDFEVLAERERRALRVHLGTDIEAGLAMLASTIGAISRDRQRRT